jgi:hypothetical protein
MHTTVIFGGEQQGRTTGFETVMLQGARKSPSSHLQGISQLIQKEIEQFSRKILFF